MKFSYITVVLAVLSVCHVDSKIVIKCFPIDSNFTQIENVTTTTSVDITTQSTQETSQSLNINDTTTHSQADITNTTVTESISQDQSTTTTQSVTESSTQSIQETFQSTSESSTQSQVDITAQSVTESSTQSESSSTSPLIITTSTLIEGSTQSQVENITESVTESTNQDQSTTPTQLIQDATQSVTQSTTTVTDSTTQSVTETQSESTSESSTQSVTENSTQSESTTPTIQETSQSTSESSTQSQSTSTSPLITTTTVTDITTQSVTESPTQSESTTTTADTTQSTTTGTTQSTTTKAIPSNFTDLGSQVFVLYSQIDTQTGYLDGNLTALNQSKQEILTEINQIDNSTLSADEIQFLQDYSAFILNYKIPTDLTTGARKKRQTTTVNQYLTPCEVYNIAAQDIQQKITLSKKQKSYINDQNKKFSSSSAIANNNDIVSKVTAWNEKLKKSSTGITATARSICSLSCTQLKRFKILQKKVCALNFGPCGSFVPYNPSTNPNELVGRAVEAGFYYDGSVSYVGTGNLTDCFQQTYIPGRCTISTSLNGPACYIECAGEHNIIDTAAYLEYSPDMVWVSTDAVTAPTVPYAIKVKGDGDSRGFSIGRYNLTVDNITYTQVAKVHIDSGLLNLFYADLYQNDKEASGPFEVLICLPTPTTLLTAKALTDVNRCVDGTQSERSVCVYSRLYDVFERISPILI